VEGDPPRTRSRIDMPRAGYAPLVLFSREHLERTDNSFRAAVLLAVAAGSERCATQPSTRVGTKRYQRDD